MGNIQATKVKTAVPRNKPDTVPRIDGGGRTAAVAKSAKKGGGGGGWKKPRWSNRKDVGEVHFACVFACVSIHITRRSVSDRPSYLDEFLPTGKDRLPSFLFVRTRDAITVLRTTLTPEPIAYGDNNGQGGAGRQTFFARTKICNKVYHCGFHRWSIDKKEFFSRPIDIPLPPSQNRSIFVNYCVRPWFWTLPPSLGSRERGGKRKKERALCVCCFAQWLLSGSEFTN